MNSSSSAPLTETMVGSSMIYPPIRPLCIDRYAELIATGSGMPSNVVTNQDLIDNLGLIASDRAVQFSIGIKERRAVLQDETPSMYLYNAAVDCISNSGISPERIDRIIYARLMGDHAIPATSLRILEKLGIRKGIPVMDISVACSGFLHATELALGYINAGEDYVLIISGDQGCLNKDLRVLADTRTVFLNGDGFASALYGHSTTQKFKNRYFYTDNSIGEFAYIPFGTAHLAVDAPYNPEMFKLTMPNGPMIHQSIVDSCRIITQRLLDDAEMTIDDIDFFITSDQTTLSWKAQLDLLGIPPEKSCSCFHKYGNTVAAMVPLNLHEAISTGKLTRGMKVLMIGHGAGASGGGFIFTY